MYIAVCVCDCSPMSIYESRKHELPRVRQQGVAAGKKAHVVSCPPLWNTLQEEVCWHAHAESQLTDRYFLIQYTLDLGILFVICLRSQGFGV